MDKSSPGDTRSPNGQHDSKRLDGALTPLTDGSFCPKKGQCPLLVMGSDTEPPAMATEEASELKPLHYTVSQTPPPQLLVLSALQQFLISIGWPLSTALVVTEIVCAQRDQTIQQQILSASMFMIGMSTFLMSTCGLRLPVFQGPSTTFLIPLLAMTNQPQWACPDMMEDRSGEDNSTTLLAQLGNGTNDPAREVIFAKLGQLSGTLMVVGVIHTLIGATGLVGILIRYIGPITLAPTITVFGVNFAGLVVKFAQPCILVTSVTCITNLILSLYLSKKLTPIPLWTRDRGFHIHWFPFHQMFAVLISILVGWALSAILTAVGFFTDDPNSEEYLARTDAKGSIISETPFFDIPYPGKFGGYSFSGAAFLSFLIASVLSVLDSIGDYSACAKICRVPPPPRFAFNRGIAVEGVATIMSGALGCCHATVSYACNIGAMGITGVTSRRVFQLCGLLFVAISVLGKVGALFLSIPLPVVGGSLLIMTGLLIGVALSYLEAINLRSTRNLGIMGIALLLSFVLPRWATKNGDSINTGSMHMDMWIKLLISNQMFVAGACACLMDNTVPGTVKERGLLGMIRELDGTQEDSLPKSRGQYEEGREVYRLPFIANVIRRSRILKIFPLIDRTES